jgi:hypothetical protein
MDYKNETMIDKKKLIDYIRYKSKQTNLLDLKVIEGVKKFIEKSSHDDFYSKELLARLERDRNEHLKYYNHGEAVFEVLAGLVIWVCERIYYIDLKKCVFNTLENWHNPFASRDTINQKHFIDLIINQYFTTNYWLKVVEIEKKFLINRIDEKHNDRRKVLEAIELLKQFSDNENLHYELNKLKNQKIETRLTEPIIYKSAFFLFTKYANEDLGLALTTKAKDLANYLLSVLFDRKINYRPSDRIEYLPCKNAGFHYYK